MTKRLAFLTAHDRFEVSFALTHDQILAVVVGEVEVLVHLWLEG